MSGKPPTQRSLGCLFGILGMIVGYGLANWSFAIHVEKVRAANPTAFICGNDAIPGMFFGLIFGALGGILFEKILSHLLDWLRRREK